MTVVLIGLAVATLALGATCAMVFLARSREAAGRIDRVLAETASAREAAQSVDRRFDELRRGLETRVEGGETFRFADLKIRRHIHSRSFRRPNVFL